MRVHYRLPHEFYGLGNNWKMAFRLWIFHYWHGNCLDIFATKGIRILGLEFVCNTY